VGRLAGEPVRQGQLMHLTRTQITVRGVVQGVGFRPFIYNLAERFGLSGWVLNDSSGVEIEVEGGPETIEAFIAAIRAEAPPLAHIESFEAQHVPLRGEEQFQIRHSEQQQGRYQLVSPDIATCGDCLRELLDPHDRRYRYPFTNCTNCGPRFTIIADIPYDRPSTTMRAFEMCPDCQAEYDDPRDRRFHAQPNACPVCGPQVTLTAGPLFAGRGLDLPLGGADVLAVAAALLRQGAILAIKGLGGFHLACDATNVEAVRLLRARKRRPDKPFAVMISTLDEIEAHCTVSPGEGDLLCSPQCPIVLLPWRSTSDIVAGVAPRYRHLGVMLPYTPLHHVLLRDVGRPLVMTSGNLTEEPIAAENDEALRRLGHLADVFLLHNRNIYARYDDSVWFVPRMPAATPAAVGAAPALPQPIRRARGYAPFPIKLPFVAGQALACGAEIKNTFCVTRDEYAFLSQHIGDMENLETLDHYQRTIALYERLFRIEPAIIAHDLHPDYMATKYAQQRAEALDVEAISVQHHHAHLVACLADNGWPADGGRVIGAIMDGTGYGPDGRIWGGEWLVGDYRGFERAVHLAYLPLPGGDAATAHPWRIAYSYLWTLLGPGLPGRALPAHVLRGIVPPEVDEARLQLLRAQLERGLNCPQTSSMGRLFDAVSALLGICTHASYEAQAAIELEAVAAEAGDRATELAPYPFHIEREDGGQVVRLDALLKAIAADLEAGVPRAEIAWRFHETAASMIARACEAIARRTGLRVVALSGGCYQNRILLRRTVALLKGTGFDVLLHRQVPCNDGGLALGQAAVACCSAGRGDGTADRPKDKELENICA
jgi:hydrogenase maturation protein HypF